MRIGIISLQHESNTFLAAPTTLEHFRRGVLGQGEEVRRVYGSSHHEVCGFFRGLAEAGLDAVPIFAAQAVPGGIVTAATYEALREQMLTALDRVGRLDGLLVAPHGAGVAENEPDMDGHWLSAVRERVGGDLPIICTLDPHANISPRMIAACDATITYRTNPHLDQHQRGIEAAELMARTLRGEVRPVQAARFPPLAINIERQSTDESPCQELEARARACLNRPRVLTTSIALGFPYADVAEMGACCIAVTDGDPALARSIADELSAQLMAERELYRGKLIGVEEAIEQAARMPRPVCLLDMGDNIGGGSPGDGTILAHALHRRRLGPSLVCLCDPQAVSIVAAAGAGATCELTVGGKTDGLHGPPLTTKFRVLSLHEGTFEESQVRHGAAPRYDMGLTAIVEAESGLVVMLTSLRVPPFSLGQLTSCGLVPARFRVIVAKGVHAPVAAYREVCPSLIRVNTPGVTTADMTQLNYRARRRPLFPFETETSNCHA